MAKPEHDLVEHEPDQLETWELEDSDGYWTGPRNLRFYLSRKRRPVALGWIAWTAVLSFGVWNASRPWQTLAHAALLASVIVLVIAFGVSRGWADGTSD